MVTFIVVRDFKERLSLKFKNFMNKTYIYIVCVCEMNLQNFKTILLHKNFKTSSETEYLLKSLNAQQNLPYFIQWFKKEELHQC